MYHINPATDQPNKCTATIRGCKYATDDGYEPPHYTTNEEARNGYEKTMEEGLMAEIVAKNPIPVYFNDTKEILKNQSKELHKCRLAQTINTSIINQRRGLAPFRAVRVSIV